MTTNDLWLPVGRHWDLHIEHSPDGALNAGPFTGGGWKIEVHLTVSPWGATRQMTQVVKAKHAEPHFVIGGDSRLKLPLVQQLLPLNVAGRALKNDSSDGYDTNRANVIQVEICANPGRSDANARRPLLATRLFALDGFALTQQALANLRGDVDLCMMASAEELEPKAFSVRAEQARAFHDGVASWGESTYAALGNLFELIRHRVPVPNKVPRSFANTTRFTDQEYVAAEGYVGHMHTPDNDHIDPTTAFRGAELVRKVRSAPNDL